MPTKIAPVTIRLKTAALIISMSSLAGLAMAALCLAVSQFISVDRIHLEDSIFLSVLVWFVIGLFYAIRFLIQTSRVCDVV